MEFGRRNKPFSSETRGIPMDILRRKPRQYRSRHPLLPKNDTPPTTYRIPIAESFKYYNYLVVKNSEGELFLFNPLSWTQISRLPSIEHSEDNGFASSGISRLVTDGSIAVALARRRRLVYTRVGPANCWVDLQDLLGFYCEDIVPYKQGLFCAVSSYKARVTALDFSSPIVKSDKATSGKQGLGIKDQPKKVAGCYWKCKKTSFSDSVGKISADSSGSAKRKRSVDLDTSSNSEPRTKLKKLCKQLLRQAPSQSLKLKELKLLVEARFGPVFAKFSSKHETLSYLKQKLERSRSFHVEGKKVSLFQGN